MTFADDRGQPGSPELMQAELARYARHLSLPQVGVEGQRKLKASSVLVVGTGGLGSPVSMYLAAAGVGRIGLVDFDVVDASNLQRQIVHGQSTLGVPKVVSAAARLRDLNPYVTVEPHGTLLTSENALDILAGYDVIVDGTDNFPARYLLNDAAVLLGKPLVYGSIFRFEGQVSVFGAADGPCYRCMLPEPPPPHLVPSCAEAGVLGVLPGTIGTLQATEALKLLLGNGQPLVGRLLLYDALDMTFETIRLRKRSDCPVCGDHPTVTALIDYDAFCGTPGYSPQVEVMSDLKPEMTVQEVKAQLDAGEPLVLLDIREPYELLISHLDGAVTIPMSELNGRVGEIPRDQPVVVMCRSGARSGNLVGQLRSMGYGNVTNMVGGINQWAREIDPSLALY
ncbi:molybdopterin-synthase adenylyltransferase MoeB [Aggregatilinea lenta]|uniref:molybdopterin-synthase adenylyltransferase MoeB n=1 Tax=Aggregatilinea lenta TaxID=913108 RepID=UPI001EE78278|nr:molybdopterin-synthase adenylyltransferase MoeB [Aggregatilinea lenta]